MSGIADRPLILFCGRGPAQLLGLSSGLQDIKLFVVFVTTETINFDVELTKSGISADRPGRARRCKRRPDQNSG